MKLVKWEVLELHKLAAKQRSEELGPDSRTLEGKYTDKGRNENNHSNLLLTHTDHAVEHGKPNLLKFLVAKED